MTIAAPNPLTNPELYDKVLLNGDPSPGLATIVGAGDPRAWDKQKGTGTSGATLKFSGKDINEFSIELRLWEPEHFVEWGTWKRHLDVQSGGTTKARDIYHPILEDLEISAVVIKDRSQLKPLDDQGTWGVAIKCMVYRPSKPASGVAKGTGGGGWANAKGVSGSYEKTANDELDDRIEELTNQFKELAG